HEARQSRTHVQRAPQKAGGTPERRPWRYRVLDLVPAWISRVEAEVEQSENHKPDDADNGAENEAAVDDLHRLRHVTLVAGTNAVSANDAADDADRPH